MSQELLNMESIGGSVVVSDLQKDVRLWRDKYVSRIEREMVLGFSLLEITLLELLQENLKLILLGRTKKFRAVVLQPAVQEWFDAVVLPILDDANREFEYIMDQYETLSTDDFDVSLTRVVGGPIAVSAAGVGLFVSGAYFGIGAKLVWFFSAVPVFNKLILIGAFLVGSILLITGVAKLAYVRERVAKIFSKSFIPKLRKSLIGIGHVVRGRRTESLRRQLQMSIEERAEQLISGIGGNGSHGNHTV